MEVNLILTNELGAKKIIYNENYVIMSDNFENINLEFTEFKDYIIVCYIEENSELKINKIKDDFLDYSFTE